MAIPFIIGGVVAAVAAYAAYDAYEENEKKEKRERQDRRDREQARRKAEQEQAEKRSRAAAEYMVKELSFLLDEWALRSEDKNALLKKFGSTSCEPDINLEDIVSTVLERSGSVTNANCMLTEKEEQLEELVRLESLIKSVQYHG